MQNKPSPPAAPFPDKKSSMLPYSQIGIDYVIESKGNTPFIFSLNYVSFDLGI
jgi:hypothetical protein